MSFIDEVKVHLKAGDGGNGCISFRREKFVAHGGPDGGTGGKGGDIFFIASNTFNTLLKLRYQPHIIGDKGAPGGSANKYGAAGKDSIIEVPVGTQIYDINDELIVDLSNKGQLILAAGGGKGGLGNAKFKSCERGSKNYNCGELGCETSLLLRLKIVADIGIIGLPNAGKSTFLSLCSNAHPKIADYAFTTLYPQIGMVKLDNYRDFIIADIPGLISGAHKGIGLGHQFLRHVERCNVLLHLIDSTQEDVVKAYNTVKSELALYSEKLINKREVVAVSRCDISNDDTVNKKRTLLENYLQHPVYTVAINQDIKQITNKLYSLLEKDVEDYQYDPLSVN